ncbi:MAG: hypothetical protein ACJ76U_17510 [Gaiellaceae bacterium]
MTTSPAERKALNAGIFRRANEKMARAAQDFDLVLEDPDALIPFLCECPKQECMEIVLLTLGEYDDVRSSGRGGLAAVGHEDPSIERVRAQNDRFVITEKFGEAGDVHAETDPRSS